MKELMKITNENIDKINIEVQKTINYGKEANIIHDVLNQFPLNNDLNIVAMKIAVIDVTNSTHLSQYKSKISLYELAEVILNIPNFDERVKNGDPELVNIIAKNNNKVNLFSFASKYCTYHNVEIYGNDHYSIFDSVVKEILPKYRTDITKYTLEKWRRKFDYDLFNKCIGEVLDENKITTKNRRRKFDHFLWYPNR